MPPSESTGGVEHLLTIADHEGGSSHEENPRWHRQQADEIARLQQAVSRKKRGSNRRKCAIQKLARARSRQARQRLEHHHQLSARLARENALVVMEELTIKNMTRSAKGTAEEPGKNVRQKAGLNREILDTAPAQLIQLIRYKVTETGGEFVDAPTRKLKPSQTCPPAAGLHARCWMTGFTAAPVGTVNPEIWHRQGLCSIGHCSDLRQRQSGQELAVTGMPAATL